MRILSTATVALSAVLLAFATVPAAAKTCKSWGFVGQALAANKAQALVLARLNWAVKVDSYWGQAWRNYNIASNKSESCQAGGGAGHKQRCTAEAIPCKP
jgi:cytochrome c oxidase assembly protein Cox11